MGRVFEVNCIMKLYISRQTILRLNDVKIVPLSSGLRHYKYIQNSTFIFHINFI